MLNPPPLDSYPHERGAVPLPDGLSRAFLMHHRVCPRRYDADGALLVSVADGASDYALDDLGILYEARVVARQVTDDELQREIERLTTNAAATLERPEIEHLDGEGTTDVRDLATQPDAIRLFNYVISEAHLAGASDVHLEASRSGLGVRFRVDGLLEAGPDCPPHLRHALLSRAKLVAQLDIAERRRPQDGRIRVRLDSRELDLRVSTVPSIHGESVVFRFLDHGGRPVHLAELGMPAEILAGVQSLAARPHGLVLVTGPTGSGKTTTLYAALQERDRSHEKIITVEDPVEYQLPGMIQVPVHAQAGVTFGSALRSILRQDPDVLMIGEMRDPETAEIGIQAAMTGHLVFSTLHTNDAVSAVPRLLDLGVPEYLVSATLEGLLAQRLVRVLCEHCREVYEPAEHELESLFGLDPRVRENDERGVSNSRVDGNPEPPSSNLGSANSDAPTVLHRAGGCARCRGTGYRGRAGIFELVLVTDALREAIARRASRGDLLDIARREGMRSLVADARQKVAAGVTTLDEVLRVVRQ